MEKVDNRYFTFAIAFALFVFCLLGVILYRGDYKNNPPDDITIPLEDEKYWREVGR